MFQIGLLKEGFFHQSNYPNSSCPYSAQYKLELHPTTLAMLFSCQKTHAHQTQMYLRKWKTLKSFYLLSKCGKHFTPISDDIHFNLFELFSMLRTIVFIYPPICRFLCKLRTTFLVFSSASNSY